MDIVLKLKLDDKEYDATIQDADKQLSALRKHTETIGDSMGKWGQIVTGFNQALELSQRIFSELKDKVLSGAELQVLRDNFRGTADDIERIRKATAQTVSEANIIKLSNQATDLGISLTDQVILFALAEDAADKYGGGTEANFNRVIQASEGLGKGLKSLGIQTAVYNQIVERLAKAKGDTIEKLDAETQKQIRLQAIIEASGITLEDATTKTQDNADKLAGLGIEVDEAREKMGLWISEQLIPLVDILGKSEKGAFNLRDAIVALTGSLPDLIMFLSGMKYLLGGATLGKIGAMGGPAAIGILAGVGIGNGINWIKENYGNPNGGYDWDRINRAVDIFGVGEGDIEGTKDLENTDNSKFNYSKSFGKVPVFKGGNKGWVKENALPEVIKKVTQQQLTEIKKGNEEKLKEQAEFDKKLIKLEEDYVAWQNSLVASAPYITSQDTTASVKGFRSGDAGFRYGSTNRVAAGNNKAAGSPGSREYLDQLQQDSEMYGAALVNVFDDVWNKIINGSFTAADMVDSIFKSLLESLGNYLSNLIMKEATSSIFDTLFSIGSSFATGGSSAIPIGPMSSVGGGSVRIEKMFDAYLSKIEKWQDKLALEAEIKNDSIYLGYNKADKIRKATEM